MLNRVDKNRIILLSRTEHKGSRAIAKELNLNRKTVQRVLRKYAEAIAAEDPDEALLQALAETPKYDESGRHPTAITPEMSAIIDSILEDNKHKRSIGLGKQCANGITIHRVLVDKGYKVSYTTVTRYIHRKLIGPDKHEEAFVRIRYAPGNISEFDWGEIKLYIDGKLCRLYMAVFTLPYSNHRKAYLFRHQNTLAFMESHRNYFADMKGAPLVMVYDNMKVAVKKFVGPTEREPTDALVRMSSFYCFQYRFCNPASGWEKGHVENSVGHVRQRAFSIQMRFATIEEAQMWLDKICDQLNAEDESIMGKQERIREELCSLQPCPGKIGCFESSEYSVDKYSTVKIANVRYSVPDIYVGKRLTVKLYSEKITVYDAGKKVAAHQRSYTAGQWIIDIEHYLRTLLRKPGAVASSEALHQMPEGMKAIFEKCFKNDPKDFVQLLVFAKEQSFSYRDIEAAFDVLRSRGLRKPSGEQLRAMLPSLRDGDSVPVVENTKDDTVEAIAKASQVSINALASIMARRSRAYNS